MKTTRHSVHLSYTRAELLALFEVANLEDVEKGGIEVAGRSEAILFLLHTTKTEICQAHRGSVGGGLPCPLLFPIPATHSALNVSEGLESMGNSTDVLGPSVRLRHDAQIGLQRLPAPGVFCLCVLVRDRRSDDDVAALLPVHRGRHLVGRRQLARVE